MKYGGYTGISVSICMFVDDFLSVHPELMKIQLYFDLPILEEWGAQVSHNSSK